jgi:hypothetical protein
MVWIRGDFRSFFFIVDNKDEKDILENSDDNVVMSKTKEEFMLSEQINYFLKHKNRSMEFMELGEEPNYRLI